MTGGTEYAFAALVCYGLGDFIYKRATTAGVKPHHFLMGQAWCFCPVVFLYAWATGTLVIGPPAAWGGLAGLLIFVAFYNFLRSLAAGSVSINAPIFRLNFVITAILAIAVLGEPLRPAMPVALALALADRPWLAGVRSDRHRGARRGEFLPHVGAAPGKLARDHAGGAGRRLRDPVDGLRAHRRRQDRAARRDLVACGRRRGGADLRLPVHAARDRARARERARPDRPDGLRGDGRARHPGAARADDGAQGRRPCGRARQPGGLGFQLVPRRHCADCDSATTAASSRRARGGRVPRPAWGAAATAQREQHGRPPARSCA